MWSSSTRSTRRSSGRGARGAPRSTGRIPERNPGAEILPARSDLPLVGPPIKGKRVVVVEDGPTLTHGGMAYGAGIVAGRRVGAARRRGPRPTARGAPRPRVPPMGYGPAQTQDLEATLSACDADLVLSATPIDLNRVLRLTKPVTRV